MGSLNLSQWAVRHPALIAFLIFAIGLGGALSYFQLGRAEDPSFTIKNVNVSAMWPGATTQEMQDQVTDRIEKKLRELAYFDKSTTYTKPGFTSIGIDFKDSTPAREPARGSTRNRQGHPTAMDTCEQPARQPSGPP